jgi:hypothetical protein
MSQFILIDDLKGRWNVSLNKYGEEDLEMYIQSFEVDILKDLLGCELYPLFLADCVPDADDRLIPVSPEYIEIYEEICDEALSTCCCGHETFMESYGMIDMLKSMIRFYWLRDQKYKQTVSGTSVMDSENSVVIKSLHYGLTKQYNRGIESYKAIQCFIESNKPTYPTYKGHCKSFAGWL